MRPMFVDAVTDAHRANDEEPPRETIELSALEESHETGESEKTDDAAHGGAKKIKFDVRNVAIKLLETRRARFFEKLKNLEDRAAPDHGNRKEKGELRGPFAIEAARNPCGDRRTGAGKSRQRGDALRKPDD